MKKGSFYTVLILIMFCWFQPMLAQVNHRHFLFAGRVDLSEERFVDAIRNFNTAIASKPDHFEAYFFRGIAKFNLSDYQGALYDFNQTIRMHPLYARAYHYRGIVNDRLTNYFDAKTDFIRALEIDPYNADLYVAYGATKMHLNDFEGAVREYDMALLIDPKLSYAWLNRGIAKRLLNRKEEALDDMNKAVYHNHFDLDSWLKRGILRNELGDTAGAMSDFNQAILIDAKNPLVYFQRAGIYLQNGDTTAALNDYEYVNILDNRNALTYYNRALLHSMRKEYEEAGMLYQEVIKINPNNIYSYFNKGIVSYEMEKYQEAIADFTHAIDLFPGFVGALINRSLSRKKIKDEAGSNADYEKAMAIIQSVSGEHQKPEALFSRYADSAYFNKIIELESDFISGNMLPGRVQYQQIDILPFRCFVVALVETSPSGKEKTPSQKSYSELGLSQLNAMLTGNLKLGYISQTYLKHENDDSEVEWIPSDDESKISFNLQKFLLGTINQNRHNYNSAAEAYNALIKDKSLNPFILLNSAVLQFDKEELTLIDDEYANAVSITSRKEPLISPTASEMREPDYSASLQSLDLLIYSYPDNAFAYYNRANIKLQQGKHHRAIDDFSEAIRLEPSMGEAYYNRALTLLYLGENKLACSDLSKAGEAGIAEAYSVIRKYCAK